MNLRNLHRSTQSILVPLDDEGPGACLRITDSPVTPSLVEPLCFCFAFIYIINVYDFYFDIDTDASEKSIQTWYGIQAWYGHGNSQGLWCQGVLDSFVI